MDDKHEYVRRAAIGNPKATAKHIDKALVDKNTFVRAAAIIHPNVNAKHINKALRDHVEYIRDIAKKLKDEINL